MSTTSPARTGTSGSVSVTRATYLPPNDNSPTPANFDIWGGEQNYMNGQ